MIESSGFGADKFTMVRNNDGTGSLKVVQSLDYEDQLQRQGFRFRIQVTFFLSLCPPLLPLYFFFLFFFLFLASFSLLSFFFPSCSFFLSLLFLLCRSFFCFFISSLPPSNLSLFLFLPLSAFLNFISFFLIWVTIEGAEYNLEAKEILEWLSRYGTFKTNLTDKLFYKKFLVNSKS